MHLNLPTLLTLLTLLTLSLAGRSHHRPSLPPSSTLTLCNGLRQQGTCYSLAAPLSCTALKVPVAYNLESLVQDQGLICAYHQGHGCKRLVFVVDATKGRQVLDVAPKWQPVLTHVVCVPRAAVGLTGLDVLGAGDGAGGDVDGEGAGSEGGSVAVVGGE